MASFLMLCVCYKLLGTLPHPLPFLPDCSHEASTFERGVKHRDFVLTGMFGELGGDRSLRRVDMAFCPAAAEP